MLVQYNSDGTMWGHLCQNHRSCFVCFGYFWNLYLGRRTEAFHIYFALVLLHAGDTHQQNFLYLASMGEVKYGLDKMLSERCLFYNYPKDVVNKDVVSTISNILTLRSLANIIVSSISLNTIIRFFRNSEAFSLVLFA